MPIVFLFLAFAGLLFFGVVSGGITTHKVMWGLLGLALLGVAAFRGPIVFLILALAGLLFFGVVSGGITTHKVMWGLLGLALLGVAAFGGLLSAFGFEAVSTGANPGAWWGMFGTLVMAPLLGYGYAVAQLFGSPRPDKKDVPPEV